MHDPNTANHAVVATSHGVCATKCMACGGRAHSDTQVHTANRAPGLAHKRCKVRSPAKNIPPKVHACTCTRPHAHTCTHTLARTHTRAHTACYQGLKLHTYIRSPFRTWSNQTTLKGQPHQLPRSEQALTTGAQLTECGALNWRRKSFTLPVATHPRLVHKGMREYHIYIHTYKYIPPLKHTREI